MATAVRQGLKSDRQADFSGGAHPQLDAVPANGLEDIVNGVLELDGSLSRRGGTTLRGSLSATDARPFINIWTGTLGAAGPFTIVSRTQGTTIISEGFSVLRPGGTDFVASGIGADEVGQQRPVGYAGMVVFVANASGAGVHVLSWAGHDGSVPDGNVTIAVNAGSHTVAGSGFSSFAAPGKILHSQSTIGDRQAVIKRVISNTSLELVEPWAGPDTPPTTVTSSTAVSSDVVAVNVLPFSTGGVDRTYASTIFDRLVFARGSRVAFTGGLDPMVVGTDDYHELPGGATVLGLEPLRGEMLVFSSAGVYAISGMAYDLTDALGNPQQRLEMAVPDVVLWDNRGVAGWRGAVVVPAVDDIYLMESPASLRAITGGVRELYQSYVAAGYRTGVAQVFQGRYFLPILDGGDGIRDVVTWKDTLVCDLRTGAWVRWDGQAAVTGLSRRLGDPLDREPQLLALGATGSTRRVQDFTRTLEPAGSNKNDADGSEHKLRFETRTFTGRDLWRHLWRKSRLRVEVTGASVPETSVRASYELGHVGSGPVPLSDPLTREGS